jgi:hypothetical protein
MNETLHHPHPAGHAHWVDLRSGKTVLDGWEIITPSNKSSSTRDFGNSDLDRNSDGLFNDSGEDADSEHWVSFRDAWMLRSQGDTLDVVFKNPNDETMLVGLHDWSNDNYSPSGSNLMHTLAEIYVRSEETEKTSNIQGKYLSGNSASFAKDVSEDYIIARFVDGGGDGKTISVWGASSAPSDLDSSWSDETPSAWQNKASITVAHSGSPTVADKICFGASMASEEESVIVAFRIHKLTTA